MISTAFAQETASVVPQTGGMMDILLMGVIIAVMWLLLIRPQSKRMKEHQALIAELKRGDNVVTEGGLCGKISKIIDESYIELELAEGVRIKHVKNAVSVVIPKEKKETKKAKK